MHVLQHLPLPRQLSVSGSHVQSGLEEHFLLASSVSASRQAQEEEVACAII